MTDQPEKLDLSSHDIAGDKIREILTIFPEIRTENGKIDFERLKMTLGETVDVGKERYGMNWPGKADCFKTLQQPSLATLRPCPEESINFQTSENLIIEGDNLEVLKLLQKSYLGKVKMIYIDPPYNTGNDFIYPDNYTESLQTYLEYTHQVDEAGKKFGTNTEADGRFHSKWLNMMYPRLYLAKNLLREDGVAFISIDDNEVDNLRKLCNEIFGEENFLATFLWKKKSTTTNVEGTSVSSLTEYVIAYSRQNAQINQRVVPKEQREYPYKDELGRFRKAVLEKKNTGSYERKTMQFQIIGHNPRTGKRWQIGEELARELEKKGRFMFEDGMVKRKIYDFEDKDTYSAHPNLLFDHGSTDSAASEVNEQLLGIQEVFPNPKPKEMIQQLIKYTQSESKNDIILDFFAGSGTTAHAVLQLNQQDGGNRKFILVQLPEPTNREDYPTIADICKERVRRVIKKLNDTKAGKLDLDDAQKQDRGFRVFKLAESNFKPWNAQGAQDAEGLEKQLELHIAHIREDRSSEDILYEILLKSGFPLTAPVEKLILAGTMVHVVANGAMFICLAHALTLEVIRAMAEKKPERVVCLDEGFAGNDQLKANAVQIFKTRGISFKTV